MDRFYFRRPLGKLYWVGLSISLGGVLLMNWGASVDWSMWKGAALATVGGMLGSAYLLIGQEVRKEVGIHQYGSVVCVLAAMLMAILSWQQGHSLLGQGSDVWMILLLMAIFPQFLGHIGMNYVVKQISATVLSLALLLEPIAASLISLWWIHEIPSTLEVFASLILLIIQG